MKQKTVALLGILRDYGLPIWSVSPVPTQSPELPFSWRSLEERP